MKKIFWKIQEKVHCICQIVLIVTSHSLLVKFWHLLLPYFSFDRGTIPLFFQFPDTDVILTHTLHRFHSFFIYNCYISVLTPFTSAALLFSNILTTFMTPVHHLCTLIFIFPFSLLDVLSSCLELFIQFQNKFYFFQNHSIFSLPPPSLPLQYSLQLHCLQLFFLLAHTVCPEYYRPVYITSLFCTHNYNQF